MFQHSLLLIYRNFKRFRSTFLINLIGLSTGLACTVLIFLWVNDELRKDKFHENDRQLFQVMTNHHNREGVVTWKVSPGNLGEALAAEMPEVTYAVSSSDIPDKFTLSNEEKHIRAAGQFVSKDFFNTFSYALLQGDKNQVLASKNAIVISEELALKLFNTTENLVGKTINWQILHFHKPVVIAGVFKTIPSGSSEQFDFLLSFEEFRDMLGDGLHWDNHNARTYLVLREGTDAQKFNQKIGSFLKSKAPNTNVTLFATPFSDLYLYGNYENGVQTGGRIVYVRLFSLIALFILLIACINFMNLSTAKASRRIKEVGIKKAMGASRQSLVLQYLGESLLMSLASLIVALMLVELSLAPFSALTGKQLTLHYEPQFVLVILGITLLTGFLAGSYPALYLSGFTPAAVLRGKLDTLAGELWARKGLVVFQFTLSVILIVSVLVVYKQNHYAQTKNLGYSKDNVIYFDAEGQVQDKLETFLAEVKKIPGVVNASSGGSIISDYSSTTGLAWRGKGNENIAFQNVVVNYGMIEVLGIQLKEGRTFSRRFAADTAKIIFNEAAVKTMAMKNPVGEVVNLWGENRKIIGVVKDFHFQSLHEGIKPMFFRLQPQTAIKVMLKIEAGRERETIAQLQQLYKAYNPGFILDYRFLNEDYQELYAAEQRVAVLSRYFAGLAVLISCLGLFGLAAFTAERRLKEIGIRKVLGASEASIVFLLSVDFTKLVLAAILIALPLSYLIADYWLHNFAYRIELAWWYFAGAGLLALVISWFTVGMQAVKASRISPSQCLKDV
ncbi:ABC transporter permease [Pontibacter akesuensis]|uniref:FtsX-like permease family protein n=1 Tax=Pontibacter akesuensis TaxID=388950 RepID=A0A1I7FRQ0_9BACT|nr:ABC transporter permease [Pontibacter akesuensis]GHA60842.1 ABC transporter permease [Pontibacter akesuensis]SFU38877.1 FtsX-like permease family protein [Pontibacter akesuensis]